MLNSSIWVCVGFVCFVLYYHLRGWMCPCGDNGSRDDSDNSWNVFQCQRIEWWGVQPGNAWCILLGYFIPQHALLLLLLHMLWEIYEWFVLAPYAKWFGGCTENGTHWWQVTLGDLLSRPLFFCIGMMVRFVIH